MHKSFNAGYWFKFCLLINRFSGKAGHSALLNTSHMKKREFKEAVESLIEREAVSVETYTEGRGPSRKVYVIDRELLDSWKV